MCSANMSRATAFRLAPITNVARESYTQANWLCWEVAYDANAGGVLFSFHTGPNNTWPGKYPPFFRD